MNSSLVPQPDLVRRRLTDLQQRARRLGRYRVFQDVARPFGVEAIVNVPRLPNQALVDLAHAIHEAADALDAGTPWRLRRNRQVWPGRPILITKSRPRWLGNPYRKLRKSSKKPALSPPWLKSGIVKLFRPRQIQNITPSRMPIFLPRFFRG